MSQSYMGSPFLVLIIGIFEYYDKAGWKEPVRRPKRRVRFVPFLSLSLSLFLEIRTLKSYKMFFLSHSRLTKNGFGCSVAELKIRLHEICIFFLN